MTNESRRGFLRASAAPALAGRPAGSSLSAVKHVVVFMQENRSFDHYFGTLQGVRGFGDRSALMLNGGPSGFKQTGVLGTYYPFHMDSSKTSSQCVIDLDHSWITQHWAVDGGRMGS